MEKFYIISIYAIFILHFPAKSTHLIGAEITASVESCQSNIYDITISLYEHPNSDVEFGNSILSVGFGEPIQLGSADDLITQEEQNFEDLRLRTVMINDLSFPGPGTYTLSYQAFNRNPELVNVLNSVNTPFYVESKLVIDPLLCNNTPQLSPAFSYQAFTGSTFLQALQAIDADGDSLSVELIVPAQDEDELVSYLGSPLEVDLRYADNPVNADGDASPTLTVDPEALVWNAPNLPGEFTLAMRINEWREINGEWQSLGYITRDLTVQVLDTVNGLSHTDIILATEDEPEKPKVQLYPNPTLGDFILEVNDDTWLGAKASIHNIIGQEMDQRTVTLGENSYNVADYQQGIYFLTLQQGELQNVLRFVKR